MTAKSYWSSVSLSTPRDRAAVLSWFVPLADGMTPYRAEILCDIATEREKKVRVFAKTEDGKHYKLELRKGSRTSSVTRLPIDAPKHGG